MVRDRADLLTLFVVVIIFRMLSVHFRWRLPRRSLKYALAQSVHTEEKKRFVETENDKVDEGAGFMISVLFVCLGNICRSPMAEAVFRHQCSSQASGTGH